MYQTIRYEKNGNIGIATINRPEALNALNSTVISELEQLIAEVKNDADLRAFILTGEGRSFTLEEQQRLVQLCAKGNRELLEVQKAVLEANK